VSPLTIRTCALCYVTAVIDYMDFTDGELSAFV